MRPRPLGLRRGGEEVLPRRAGRGAAEGGVKAVGE
jgi:hypothetical protein